MKYFIKNIIFPVYILLILISCNFSDKINTKTGSIDSLNHFTNIKYGHFTKFHKANGKIFAKSHTSTNLFLYKDNGKLDFIISYKDRILDFGYCELNNRYYILSSDLVEYNPIDNTFKPLLVNNDYRLIEIENNLLFLKSITKTVIYDLSSGKILFEGVNIIGSLKNKRIDTKKSLLIAKKKGKDFYGILNYSKINSDSLWEKWTRFERHGIGQFSESGDYVYGYTRKKPISLGKISFTVFDSSTGKVVAEIDTKGRFIDEIGDLIILSDYGRFELFHKRNFEKYFDSENAISHSVFGNYIVTDKNEIYVIKNKTLYKVDHLDYNTKELGDYTSNNDLLKYFNLDSTKLKFVYWDKSFDSELFNFTFKQEKLVRITAGDIDFDGNTITFNKSIRSGTPNSLYNGWSENKAFVDHRNKVVLNVSKESEDNLHECTLRNKYGKIKSFKITKDFYVRCFHSLRNPIFFSDDYKYFAKENFVYNIDQKVVIRTKSRSDTKYFDIENHLLYTPKLYELEIYDLNKSKKIDSILFDKPIQAISLSENKQIALLKMDDNVNLLYDLKMRNIICSFRFIRGNYNMIYAGIIIQSKGNFYYSCQENYKELLLNTNKHICFKDFNEFSNILKNNYNISFDDKLFKYRSK